MLLLREDEFKYRIFVSHSTPVTHLTTVSAIFVGIITYLMDLICKWSWKEIEAKYESIGISYFRQKKIKFGLN